MFDMDDTIFDHARACRSALRAVRRDEAFLRSVPLDELYATYDRLLTGTHRAVLKGRTTPTEARRTRWELLARRYGGPQGREEVLRLTRSYRRAYLNEKRTVPGAPEVLRRIHGATIVAVVTDNVAHEQNRTLRSLGVRQYVDHLIASADLGAPKPHPAVFRTALRRAGVAPQDAVMVGNSWAHDVLGARKAGVPAIWFNRFHLPRPEGPPVLEVDRFLPVGRFVRLLAEASRPSRGRRSARIISRPPVLRR